MKLKYKTLFNSQYIKLSTQSNPGQRTSKRIKQKCLTALIVCLPFTLTTAASNYKHNAVDPQNLHEQSIKSPQAGSIFSHSSMLPVYAPTNRSNALTSKKAAIAMDIHLDSQQDSPLLFVSPFADQWSVSAIDPNGQLIQANQKDQSPLNNIQIGSQSYSGKTIMLPNATNGSWQVKLHQLASGSEQKPVDTNKPIGYLMFKGDPGYQLVSHLDTQVTTLNNKINITAYIAATQSANQKYSADNNPQAHRKALLELPPMAGLISRASAIITSPSGKTLQLQLNDAGLDGDLVAGDGIYSRQVPSDEVGVYSSQVQVNGIRSDGLKFTRTTMDLYPVVSPNFELKERPAELILDGNDGVVKVFSQHLGGSNETFLGAELWGTNSQGKMQPATWIGGNTQADKKQQLSLYFDLRWLAKSQLTAPFEIRNLRVQTIDSNVPTQSIEKLALIASPAALAKINSPAIAQASQQLAQIKSSELPASFLSKRFVTNKSSQNQLSKKDLIEKNASGSKLLLVHGYCSGSVWNTGYFSNAVEFKDYKQNRSHNDFAQRILSFGSAYNSYGIVAHSQGGAAALELYTKYWSGLDNATGGQLIQSVGTPYQGTSLAGNLAALGSIFGVGCGKNTNLTYSGASNWLATVPSWARSKVDYHTTSFKTRWWAYDYCHLGSDLLLSDPEDGTTEKWSGQLSGAINRGHKKGWCHTSGMRDPAQYLDASRNSYMNSRAAR
ncbi:choice-of-anchor X domain-containing protein [Aliikangiella sp. IMCC44653]